MSEHGREKWLRVISVLSRHFYKPDLQAVRAVYSAIAAHDLVGQPVWPMIVAPPGSAKTSTLEPLATLPDVYLIDKVTPNTFLSGQLSDKSPKRKPSLLHRIGDSGIIIFPDFSTVLAMKRDDRAAVLADMRRIYDGHLRKEVGTSSRPLDWNGRITFAVAATPDVDRYYSIFQTLGERFVMIRWHRPGGQHSAEKAAMIAMKQNVENVRRQLQIVVENLFAGLPKKEVTVSDEFRTQIAALAEFVVRARTHVGRDSSHSKNVTYMPEPEAPTRLSQQLCQLARGSARLNRRREVSTRDLALVRRVALDCIPALRRRILSEWLGNAFTVRDIPKSTLSYIRSDLELVGLLDGTGLSPLGRRLLRRALFSSPSVPLS